MAQVRFRDGGAGFSGRLPMRWAASTADIPIDAGTGKTPLCAYGFGLAYP